MFLRSVTRYVAIMVFATMIGSSSAPPPPFSGRHISDIGTTVAVARIISADMGRTSVAMAAKPTARLLPCAESIARMRICRAA